MTNNYHPTDVLLATIHHSFKTGEYFRHNPQQWAAFFYAQKDKLPEIITIFALRDNCGQIQSRPDGEYASPLEQAFLNLAHCRLISGIGLTGRHQTEDALQKSYESFAGKRISQIEPKIKQIAAEFREEFKQ